MKKPTRKALTDESIISAILDHGSIRAAAAALGVQERTIYNRQKKPQFIALFNQAKRDLLLTASHKLQNRTGSAVDTLAKIMNDKEIAPQTRANCAATILQYAAKYAEYCEIIERLESLEAERGQQ